MSKLPGINGFNYKRLASIEKVSGVYSNVVLCFDWEGLEICLGNNEMSAVLKDWAQAANNTDQTSEGLVLYFHYIKFYPTAQDVQDILQVVQSIPNNSVLIELVEGSESMDNVQIFGNRSDLLPENLESLLVDSLSQSRGDDSYVPVFEEDPYTPGEEGFAGDYHRDLPRFIE